MRLRSIAATALLVLGLADFAQAQIVRNFTPRHARTDRGNYLAIGNTLMTCPDAASSCAAARAGTGSVNNNQDFTMVAVDVDTVDPGANSSSATLTIPVGATVQFAGIYWGATSSSAARNQVRLRTPASATYNSITSSQLDVSGTAYHAFADVTALVSAGSSGSYTVADVKATTGTNTYAGWSMVVLYSLASETPRNVTVFDGFASVASGGGGATITVSGFVTPPSGTVNTRMAAVSYEGDLGNPGDGLRLNSVSMTNALNAANNVFNSTISNLGVHVTAKTPNYVNQLGYDLDSFDATGILANSATSATAQFTPGSDNYLPGVLVFSTDVFQPLLAPNFVKTVTDVNGGLVTPGDILEYTVSVANTGNDGANSVVLTDAIPADTTYVAGSLSVVTGANAGAKTDASGDDQANFDSGNNRVVFRLGTGATSAVGGSLAASASTSIRFRVLIGAGTANGTTLSNTAAITYIEQQLGGSVSITSNTATTTINVPDLAIAKSHSGSFVRGAAGTYSVVVSNPGLGATSGTVTVSDTLPAGLTPTTATGTGWSCSILGQAVTCTRADALAAGSSYPAISIATTVSQSAAASVSNTATVSGGGQTNTANDSSTDPTSIVSSSDLAITKTGPGSTVAGSNVVYTVTVTNNGSSDATAVSVADPTPSGLTFVSNTGDCTTAYPCSLGTVPAGATRTITTTFSLPPSYTTPTTIVNTATVSSTTSDPTGANNSASASTPVTPTTDLSISKSGPGSVTAGGNVVYTVVVSNLGGLSAAAVSVADPTPAGLVFVSNAGDCTTAYPCSLGTLAPAATRTITTTYSVPSSYTTPSPFLNTATVSSTTGDPVAGNNSSTASTTVAISADVAISKTGPVSAIAGQNVVYSVVVTNNGLSDATAVSVADTTPSGLSFVSNSGDCTTAYPCSLGTLAAGATRTITTTYSMPSSYTTPSPLLNTATVSSTTTDPTPANNSATSSTPVAISADLSVTKTGPPSALAGNNVVYTVTVTNNGSSDAAAVSVADPTPSGLTFVSNTGDCTTAYPCALGTVTAGATRTITTTYALPPTYSTPSTIVNTATASSSASDPVPANNSASASTPVTPSTDLSISKTGPGSATAGANVVYTVVVSNLGGLTAAAVAVFDPTPSGLVFVSNSGDCTHAYPCPLGAIPAGETRTITTTYSVPSSYSAPDPIGNTATVSTTTFDPVPANDSATVTTPLVISADLSVSKTGPVSVVAGSNVVFTVLVTNNGSSDASAVSVADPTPAGLTFVSNAGDCTSAYPCALGSLAAGQSRSITTTYTVPAGYAGANPILNTATVSSATGDPSAANNSSTSSTPVTTSADLAITKTGPVEALAGENLVYTVVVTNNGLSNAAAVSVADPTPAGLVFVSNSGHCTGAYPCSLGIVPAGATRTITTTYSVPSSYTSPDPVVNTATVSSTTADPVAANNSSTSSTPLTVRADLAVSKTGPASVLAGENVVYTVIVTNNGSADAAAVSVADPTPAGLTFVSNTGSCTTAYPCALGTLADGATRTITSTYAVPPSYSTPNPIENTATVSSSTTDPVAANNTSTDSTTVNSSADLTVSKTGPATIVAGNDAVFTVTVTNNGVSDATAVTVADPTPAGLVLVSNTGDCTTAYPCVLGTMAPGQTRTITTTYEVPSSYTTPSPFLNTATVSSNATDPVPANNTSTSSTTVTTSADLSIDKAGPVAVIAGTDLVYTVTVINNGESDALAVSVADPTPSGLTFVSNSGDCATAYPCALGTVPAGAILTITSTYSVPLTYTSPVPILNTATVSSTTTDPVAANNSSTSSTGLTILDADLAATKTGSASVIPGTNVVYTVVVTNNGPDDAPSASVADLTPQGLVFVSNTGDCATAYPCALGALTVGATRTITSTYSVPASYTAPDPIENTARAFSNVGDSVPGNNASTVLTAVTPSADLALTKTGPATVNAGEDVVYTVTVTNGGSSDAAAVSVADPTPAGLVFMSNSGDCSTAYPCSLGILAAGATRIITTTFSVPASYSAPGPIVNTATVSSSTTDPDGSDDSDSASTTVTTSADLAITKTGPPAAIPGANLVYTVTVTNNGSSDAAAVSVADPTPAGLAFVSNTGDCTTTYPCSLGTVAAGATRTITTTYSVPALYSTPDPIVNTATVSSTTSDPVAANNSSSSSTPVTPSADVSISKTGPVSVVAGTSLVYTVTVTNDGGFDAAAVTVADATPAGLTFVSNTGDCTTAYPCSLGTVPSGATRTITSTFAVPASYTTPDPIVNTATVSSTTADPDAADNTSTSSTPVTTSADLVVTKSDTVDPVQTDSPETYTIGVTNMGPSNATSVVVTDTLDPATSYVSDTAGCAVSLGTLTCNLPALASGASTSFTVNVMVSLAAPVDGTLQSGPCDGSEDICNTVVVDAAQSDPNLTNNTDTEPTDVEAPSIEGLSLVITDSPDPVESGSRLTYVLTFSNAGTATIPAAALSVTYDARTTFVSSTPVPTSGDDQWSLGTLAPGQVGSITVEVDVDSGTIDGDNLLASAELTGTHAIPATADEETHVREDLPGHAALSVVKTASPVSVPSGGLLTYTIDVTNGGPATAYGTLVSDELPAGLAYLNASPTPDLVFGNTVTWNAGDLPAGSAVTYTVYVEPDAMLPAGTLIENSAYAQGTPGPGTVASSGLDAEGSVAASASGPAADCELVLRLRSLGIALPSGEFVYRLLWNDPCDNAPLATITLDLDPNLTFVSLSSADVLSSSVTQTSGHDRVILDVGTIERGRVGGAFVRTRLSDAVAPGTVLISDLTQVDAALRTLTTDDSSTVRNPSEVVVTRSFLRVTGPLRVLAGSTPMYVVRYRDVPPNTSVVVTVAGGFSPLSFRPSPTETLTPPVGATAAWAFRGLEGRGIIKVRGEADFEGPDEASGVLSIDAIASDSLDVEIVKSGRDAGVLARTGTFSDPSLTKGRVVLKTQHFARGGKNATARLRYRKLLSAPEVTLNLPTILIRGSYSPISVLTLADNAFHWDNMPVDRGLAFVKTTVPDDLIPQESLAVGATVTDEFGTILAERAKGAP